MRWAEALESRRLFAVVSWDIGFSGSAVDAATRASLTNIVSAAGKEWTDLIPDERPLHNAITLSVNIVITSTAGGIDGNVNAGSNEAITTNGKVGGIEVFDQGATTRTRYGDAGFNEADIVISLNKDYLANELWLDPDPLARTALIDPSRIDAYSAILHEFGHAFFFNGFRDYTTYALLPDPVDGAMEQSVFDTFMTVDGSGNPIYIGSNGMAANGGAAIALTIHNPYHFGNETGAGIPLVADLMNGVRFPTGQRVFMSALDKAVATDLISAGTRLKKPDPDPGTGTPTPTFTTLTFNGSYAFTTTSGARVTVAIGGKGGGSGEMIFAGTFSSATTGAQQVVGDPLSLKIFGTNAKQTLSITSTSAVTLGSGLSMSTVVGSLTTTNVTLDGIVTVPGLGVMNVAGFSGATVTVGASVKNSVVTIGSVANSNVTIPVVKSLAVSSMTGTSNAGNVLTVAGGKTITISASTKGTINVTGAATTVTLGSLMDTTVSVKGLKTLNVSTYGTSDGALDVITTGTLGALSAGAFAGDLEVQGALGKTTIGSLNKAVVNVTGKAAAATINGAVTSSRVTGSTWGAVVVKGAMTSSTWIATSALGAVTVAGALTNSTVLGVTGVGAVAVGSATGSRLVAGLPLSSAPAVYPTTTPGFAAPKASIKSLKVGAFSDTLVLAPNVGAVTAAVQGSTEGAVFGIFTDAFGGFKGSTGKDPVLAVKAQKAGFKYTDGSFFSIQVV